MRDGPHDIPSVLMERGGRMSKIPRTAKGGGGGTTNAPSLHGEATIIYRGCAAVLPDVDVAGTNRLALVGVEPAREQGEGVARDGEEDLQRILGGAYAGVLKGRLLVVGRGHAGERGAVVKVDATILEKRGGEWNGEGETLGHDGTTRARPYSGQARDKNRFRP